MRVLGVNALFHDPSAALVIDGRVVAAAEEERFSRRKHGKRPVPFAAWEMPELAMRCGLEFAGLRPQDLDVVGYSFDPALAKPADEMGLFDPWDHLRVTYAQQAPQFLATAVPGLDPQIVRFVPHHVAHAASAALARGRRPVSVLVLDGRGERESHLAGRYSSQRLTVLASQELPHSLGLLYESLTEHLGFLRSSDEDKVMALASYGRPRFLDELRTLIRSTGDGGFVAEAPDWNRWAPPRVDDERTWGGAHADLACSVQARLEEVLVDLARWIHEQTGDRVLTLAGGTALNCVANSRIWRETPFDDVWVQPAAGDARHRVGRRPAAHRGRRTRCRRRTWSGSTTSRAGSTSVRSPRWCSTGMPKTSSPVGRCPALTCCSCIGSGRNGPTADGPQWDDTEHEVDRWCRPVTWCGGACDRQDVYLERSEARSSEILLHPGAAAPARRWPPDRWAQLAAHLVTTGNRVTLTGGPAETALCHRIVETVKRSRPDAAAPANTAGQLGLPDLANRVGRAKLLVSGDTGVAHLATAYRTPSVLLFGPTPPHRCGPCVDPRLHTVLWHGADDRPGNPHGALVDPALAAIEVSEVMAAIAAAPDPATGRTPA